MADFKRGMIVAFWAQGGELPDGWAICDGSNGTPDLRDQFIRGGRSLADLNGQHLGRENHSHTFSARTGVPVNGLNSNCTQGDSGITLAGNDHQHDLGGTTSNEPLLPPHVVLLYLMKI